MRKYFIRWTTNKEINGILAGEIAGIVKTKKEAHAYIEWLKKLDEQYGNHFEYEIEEDYYEN